MAGGFVAMPDAKKSDRGASTLGFSSPSQYARRMTSLKFVPPRVIQICRTTPGPSATMMAVSFPGSSAMQGRTFQPWPNSREALPSSQSCPMASTSGWGTEPGTAMAPEPFLP